MVAKRVPPSKREENNLIVERNVPDEVIIEDEMTVTDYMNQIFSDTTGRLPLVLFFPVNFTTKIEKG